MHFTEWLLYNTSSWCTVLSTCPKHKLIVKEVLAGGVYAVGRSSGLEPWPNWWQLEIRDIAFKKQDSTSSENVCRMHKTGWVRKPFITLQQRIGCEGGMYREKGLHQQEWSRELLVTMYRGWMTICWQQPKAFTVLGPFVRSPTRLSDWLDTYGSSTVLFSRWQGGTVHACWPRLSLIMLSGF